MSVLSVKPFLTLYILISVTCFFIVFGDDSLGREEGEEDASREMKAYMPEAWHAVQTVPEGAFGWIPREPIDSQPGVPNKRRRLRKRKRRPPIVSYLDQSVKTITPSRQVVGEEIYKPKEELNLPLANTRIENEDTEYVSRKKIKIPNIGDPWEELQEESVKPYIRRKVTPAYQISDDFSANYSPLSATIQFGPESPSNPKNLVKQEDRFHEENSFLSTTTKKTPNLKEILKQNGGLSLSEILQQKNITLSELLMGKKETIKAFTEPSKLASSKTLSPYSDITKAINTGNHSSIDKPELTKYKRLPPSIALRKESINRRYEQYSEFHESLSDKETMDAQRKRLALLRGHNNPKNAQNGKFSEVTRYEVITEPTTEKRIFVPSHPKLYTSVDYKPTLQDLEAITESYLKTDTPITEAATQKPTITTDLTPKHTQTIKYLKWGLNKAKTGLPITSAKLMKMATKKMTTSSEKVSTSVIEEENYPKMTGMNVQPLKISVKDIFGFQNSENDPEEKVPDEPLRMSIDLETDLHHSTLNNMISEYFSETITTESSKTLTKETPKLKPYTAKDEILEILNDPVGRAGLARILEARNMTVQELIEQRERGSSQLHLADIFHNKTREPEPLDDALEGKISSEVFTSFPVFVRQPKALLIQETTSQKPVESTSQENDLSVTAFPSFKIETNKDPLKPNKAFPWQKLYPDLFHVQDQNSNKKPQMTLPGIKPAGILTEEVVQRLDYLDQKLYSAVSGEQLNIVDENPQKILNISSGVKSAIIASLAIVLLSMIVFVTILVIFRWTQRRKKRLDYSDSLEPALFDVKPRNIKTFVAETLGKTKVNYYKRHLQSMSDDGSWKRGHDRKNVF